MSEPRRANDYSEAKPPKQYEIVQANERVPHWFRCLVVVDEVKTWGIQGYTTIPNRGDPPGDAYIRLTWDEIEQTGGYTRFIVKEAEDDGAKPREARGDHPDLVPPPRPDGA
jgi:hypothetical protein